MLPLVPGFRSARSPVVLALGAHADDIEIGCSATLQVLALTHPGCEVHWIVFSATGARAEEARSSAAMLLEPFRAKNIELHEFRNAYFPAQFAAVKDEFERIKQRVDPDIVFTHDQGDLHQDHALLGKLTWNTFRNHLILEYEVPKYDGGLRDPNLFVPIEQELCDRKIALLLQHFQSQSNRHWFTRDTFLALMRLRGVEGACASGLAEAFHCRKARLTFQVAKPR